jgi:hypothetical protein
MTRGHCCVPPWIITPPRVAIITTPVAITITNIIIDLLCQTRPKWIVYVINFNRVRLKWIEIIISICAVVGAVIAV